MPRGQKGVTVAHINVCVPLELERVALDRASEQKRNMSAMVTEAMQMWAEHLGLVSAPEETPQN